MSVDSLGRVIVGSGHFLERAPGMIEAFTRVVVGSGRLFNRAPEIAQVATRVNELRRVIPPPVTELPRVVVAGGHSQPLSWPPPPSYTAPKEYYTAPKAEFRNYSVDDLRRPTGFERESRRSDIIPEYSTAPKEEFRIETVKHHHHKDKPDHNYRPIPESELPTLEQEFEKNWEFSVKNMPVAPGVKEECYRSFLEQRLQELKEQDEKRFNRLMKEKNLDSLKLSVEAMFELFKMFGYLMVGDDESAAMAGHDAAQRWWEGFKLSHQAATGQRGGS